MAFGQKTPQVRPKSEIDNPKRDDKHPRPFDMGIPPARVVKMASSQPWQALTRSIGLTTLMNAHHLFPDH